jgi:RanBP1 domain
MDAAEGQSKSPPKAPAADQLAEPKPAASTFGTSSIFSFKPTNADAAQEPQQKYSPNLGNSMLHPKRPASEQQASAPASTLSQLLKSTGSTFQDQPKQSSAPLFNFHIPPTQAGNVSFGKPVVPASAQPTNPFAAVNAYSKEKVQETNATPPFSFGDSYGSSQKQSNDGSSEQNAQRTTPLTPLQSLQPEHQTTAPSQFQQASVSTFSPSSLSNGSIFPNPFQPVKTNQSNQSSGRTSGSFQTLQPGTEGASKAAPPPLKSALKKVSRAPESGETSQSPKPDSSIQNTNSSASASTSIFKPQGAVQSTDASLVAPNTNSSGVFGNVQEQSSHMGAVLSKRVSDTSSLFAQSLGEASRTTRNIAPSLPPLQPQPERPSHSPAKSAAASQQGVDKKIITMTPSTVSTEPFLVKVKSHGSSNVPQELSNDEFADFDKSYRLRSLNAKFKTRITALDPDRHDFEPVIRFYAAQREAIGHPIGGLYHRVKAGEKRKMDEANGDEKGPNPAKRTKLDTPPISSIRQAYQPVLGFSAINSVSITPQPAAEKATRIETLRPAFSSNTSPHFSTTVQQGPSASNTSNVFKSMLSSSNSPFFGVSASQPASVTAALKPTEHQNPTSVSSTFMPLDTKMSATLSSGSTPLTNKTSTHASSGFTPLDSKTPASTSSLFAPLSNKVSSTTFAGFTPQNNKITAPPFGAQSNQSAMASTAAKGSQKTSQLFQPRPIPAPGLQPPKFSPAAGTDFMAAFAAQAKKNAAKLEAENKAKRKAEDFDSDEDDEAEYERKVAEEDRAKRAKIEALAKEGSGFTPVLSAASSANGASPAVEQDGDSYTESSPEGNDGSQESASPESEEGQIRAEGDEDLEGEAEEDESDDDNDIQAAMAKSIAKKRPSDSSSDPKSLFNRITRPDDSSQSKASKTEEASPPIPANNSSLFSDHFGARPDDSSQGKGSKAEGASPPAPANNSSLFSDHFGTRPDDSSQGKGSKAEGASPPAPANNSSLLSGPPGTGLFGSRPTTPNHDSPKPFGSSLFGNAGSTTPTADNTWKPGSAIKFGAPSSVPAFNITPATPQAKTNGDSTSKPFGSFAPASSGPKSSSDTDGGAPKHSIGVFGASSFASQAPSGSNTGSSKPFSNLFGDSSKKTIANQSSAALVGFPFGIPPKIGGSPLLAATNVSSAITSRATSPGLTDNDSAAESGPDDQGNDPQPDYMASRPGEENEDILFEVRTKALESMTEKELTTAGSKGEAGWKTRGLGPLRVLKDSESGRTRIVMRSEPNANVVVNSPLIQDNRYDITPSGSNGASLKMGIYMDGKLKNWVFKIKAMGFARELVECLVANEPQRKDPEKF